MALDTYANLQAALRAELDISDTGALPDAAVVDAINRAEAKINRRARFREMEQLAYATYSASSTGQIESRLLAPPTGMLEMITLKVKVATANDSTYESVPYVTPAVMVNWYGKSRLVFTLRDQIEFNVEAPSDREVMMHYYKGWDLATNSTNWLLTNYPDVYYYGALAELQTYIRDDERMLLWKGMFDEGIRDLNRLDERSRDDAELSTSEVAQVSYGGSYSIITDSY